MAFRSSLSTAIPLVAAGLLLVALGLAWALRGPGPRGADAPPGPGTPPVDPTRAGTPPGSGGAPPEAPDPGVPLTDLPLRLVATVVRENASLSLATVEDLDRTTYEVLNEGDRFRDHPQASVVRIERGRILLDNDGVREQLVIDRSDRAPLATRISPEEAQRRRDMGRRLRELTEAGTDALEEPERAGLLAEGDVSPVYGEDGELIGVRLDAIREGGFYDQIGLRDGDVVTDISGVSLGEPAAIAAVMARFATSDEVTVDVESADGRKETISIPSEFVFGGMNDLVRPPTE